ncbi:Transposable element Tc3 transposase [Eumeta japonica]|uniref:Transposable element Tc3 transposase n=1 Tax=Eumeta variegata TaxID=151549 RepID=A0A4C1TIH3_EUMVA|nr:Transposable element Tc3 transposase [Eumeta japonica]
MNHFTLFNNVLFCDEAHFHINGHVNRQNCCYWSSENPPRKHQRLLHSPKITVWAAMSAHGIIGPYFFENDHLRAVTIISKRYVAMIENFFTPELQNFPGFNTRIWFQQDGATAHISNTAMPVVRQFFSNKVIFREGDIPWPPRSPNLSPIDCFL